MLYEFKHENGSVKYRSVYSDSTKWNYLMQKLTVSDIKMDLFNSTCVAIIEWNDLRTKKKIRYDYHLGREDLFNVLVERGVSIAPSEKEIVAEYLTCIVDQCMKTSYVHKCLGFYDVDEKKVFLGEKSIGEVNDSTYNGWRGRKLLKQIGTAEEWMRFVEKEVHCSRNMTLLLCLSLAAPVVSLLQAKIGTPAVIIELFGDSSIGKTTGLSFIAGQWGSRKLIQDFNATTLALEKMVISSHGFPMFYDESTESGIDSKSIYSLSGGKARVRLSSSGELNYSDDQWNGILFITGETSLLNNKNKYKGVRARVITFNRAWTKDAEHSERIIKCVDRCAGFAYRPFVKMLLETDIKELEALFDQQKNFMDIAVSQLNIKIDKVLGRTLNIYAVFMVTAILINKLFDFEISISDLRGELVDEILRDYKTNDFITTDYEKFKQACILNNNCFDYEQNKKIISMAAKSYGVIREETSVTYVDMLSEHIDEFLKQKAQLSIDVGKFVNQLKENKLLIYTPDSNRCTQRIHIHKKRVYVYRIILEEKSIQNSQTGKGKK